MKVLITGGAGFIGSHTCDALVKAGHQVRILDCLDPQVHGPQADIPGYLPQSIEFMFGDLRFMTDCLSALDGIEAVLHLAARTGVGQSMYDIHDYVETNVKGTATLLEAIVKSKTQVKRFVLASSRAIYGEGLYRCKEHGKCHPVTRSRQKVAQGCYEILCSICGSEMQPIPTPEDCPPSPQSVYAWTKVHQENYCQWAAETFSIPMVILRYFNVFGSRQSLKNPYTGVVSIFYSLLKAKRSLSMYEGGKPIRDFVHVNDIVQANLLALERYETIGRKFNVGTGHPNTIADVALALGNAMGISPKLEDRGEYRVGDIFACYANLEEATTYLGYSPKVHLAEGMEEFVNWAQNEHSTNQYDKTVAELSTYGLIEKNKL